MFSTRHVNTTIIFYTTVELYVPTNERYVQYDRDNSVRALYSESNFSKCSILVSFTG